MKRKPRKAQFKLAVRGQAVRLKPADCLETQIANAQRTNHVPADLLDHAASPDSDSARVMLVITLAVLAFIGFIAWCITQMPTK